jgi:hypothetical protein
VFFLAAGIGWVVNSPSINLQCCLPVPGTADIFIGCFGITVGSFNFQGYTNNFITSTDSFNLENVLGMSDV